MIVARRRPPRNEIISNTQFAPISNTHRQPLHRRFRDGEDIGGGLVRPREAWEVQARRHAVGSEIHEEGGNRQAETGRLVRPAREVQASEIHE